jgi:hypothetical protein
MSLEVRGYERYRTATPLSLNDPDRRRDRRRPFDNRSPAAHASPVRAGASPKPTAGMNRLPGCLTGGRKDKIFLDF